MPSQAPLPALDLADARAELAAREPLFHRPEHGTTRADFDAQMAPSFVEVGASGRRYSRAFVRGLLTERWSKPHEDLWQVLELECRALAENTYLVTYTLQQKARETRRVTIWQRTAAGWQAEFHQGTLVAP